MRGILAAVLLASTASAPVIAAGPNLYGLDPSDPRVAGVVLILTELGATPQDISDLLANATIDQLSDFFDPTTLNAAIDHADGADIETSTVFEVHTSPEQATAWFSAGGPLAPGAPGVISPIMRRGGAIEHDFYVYATSLVGPPVSKPGFRAEVGLATFNPTPPWGGVGVPWTAAKAFPGDLFNGMNMAWSTRSDGGAAFGLHALWYMQPGAGFVESATDAVSVTNGNAVVTLIPESEATGFKTQRAFGFYGSLAFDPKTFVADTSPDITKPPNQIATLPEVTIGGTASPAPPPVTTTFDPAGCTGAPFYIDRFYPDVALNGAQPSSFDTGGLPICMTSIATYHWNDGKGTPTGGSISLADAGGHTVGSFAAHTTPATNDVPANWVAQLTTPVLLNGTYQVIDSDPTTWSSSKASGGLGMFRVWGVGYIQPGATGSPGPATPSPTGSSTTGNTGSGVPWIVVLIGGLVIVALGGWLFFFGRKPGPGGAGAGVGVVSLGGTGDMADPCPPLLAALAAAKAACDEAMQAAADAEAKAKAAQAAADAARSAAEKAKAARGAAEKELAKRQKPPEATTLGSTNYGGRHVEVSDYDLYPQAQARAEANAAHDAAVAAATDEAGRVQAHEDWADALKKIDGPDGLDEVRRRDAEFRAKWIREAEDALRAAKDAEVAANADADRTAAAAKDAAAAAVAARKAADDACAAAAAAEQAAIDAGCIGPARPPTPPVPPTPQPQPGPGPQPDPPKPGGVTDGPGPGGGGPSGGGSKAKPPVTPEPHGNECTDGDEQWRTEGPSATFLVPVPGAKVQIACDPPIVAFDEYMQGWTGFDASGHQGGDPAPGVPSSAFAHAGDGTWRELFGKIEKKAKVYEITFSLPLQEVTVHCQRRYECQNGYWVRTSTTRTDDSDPIAKPRTFQLRGAAVGLNEVVSLARQAVSAWKAALQADKDRLNFRCP